MTDVRLPCFTAKDLETTPIERSETIPASWYTGHDFHELDTQELLPRHWQYVGHASQIAEPGDYLVAEVSARPIIIVRNQKGELNCFYNVCRHRGGPLARENGHGKMLRCVYHAWSYNLDGELVGTPRFEGVENFDKKNCRLPRVRLGNYEGLLFVDLSGEAPPIEEVFGGIRERIAPTSLSDMVFARRVLYEVKCNWKVYVDNFMEGYHIQPVHPELARILDVKGYTTELLGQQVLQFGPIRDEDNPYHARGGFAYYYFVFPNIMLNIMPGRLQMNAIIPVAPDRTVTIFDFFYTERDPERVKTLIEDDHSISDLIQKQDVEICELVQKGLASGAYDRGRFSVLEEVGVHAFQSLLRAGYGRIDEALATKRRAETSK